MSEAKTVKEVLKAAKWILQNKGWCQGAYAKTENGISVPTDSSRAACFCSSGAVKAVETTDALLAFKARDILDGLVGTDGTVIAWNDKRERTREQVLELFDKAINEAK